VAFVKKPALLVEQAREPFQNPRISGNDGGPGGSMPGVMSLTVIGPHDPKGLGQHAEPTADLRVPPSTAAQENVCASDPFHSRRAFRGPVPDDALSDLLRFYSEGRTDGGTFDAGIEFALRRLLVSPEFLFRVEPIGAGAAARRVAANPEDAARTGVYRVLTRSWRPGCRFSSGAAFPTTNCSMSHPAAGFASLA
jgi:hypothetical protein